MSKRDNMRAGSLQLGWHNRQFDREQCLKGRVKEILQFYSFDLMYFCQDRKCSNAITSVISFDCLYFSHNYHIERFAEHLHKCRQ